MIITWNDIKTHIENMSKEDQEFLNRIVFLESPNGRESFIEKVIGGRIYYETEFEDQNNEFDW